MKETINEIKKDTIEKFKSSEKKFDILIIALVIAGMFSLLFGGTTLAVLLFVFPAGVAARISHNNLKEE